jgi:hypothetical protein
VLKGWLPVARIPAALMLVIANNRCVEGMVASGTDSCCFNVGRCGCCIPRYSENVATSRLGNCWMLALVRTTQPVHPSNAQMVQRQIYP